MYYILTMSLKQLFLVLLLILAVLCASDIRTRVMKKPHIADFYDERAKYGYIVLMVCFIGLSSYVGDNVYKSHFIPKLPTIHCNIHIMKDILVLTFKTYIDYDKTPFQ